jgi:hypothetical protein
MRLLAMHMISSVHASPSCPQGDRFFLTLNKAGAFLLLDTSVPDQPKVLDSIYFGAGSAPHYITPVAPGDNRVAVTDYFLDQGAIGKVHAPGLKKVRAGPGGVRWSIYTWGQGLGGTCHAV